MTSGGGGRSRLPGPLHALITGREDEVDRRLAIARAPKSALVGSGAGRHPVIAGSRAGGSPDPRAHRREPRRRRSSPNSALLPGSTVDIPVEIAHGGDNIFEFATIRSPAS
ncbi:MAG: hypothetical protein HPM95_14625 [Alphaproteobacteria bacterium]|nr:hypothetical protein [Alphaproteobacteria bacterium]